MNENLIYQFGHDHPIFILEENSTWLCELELILKQSFEFFFFFFNIFFWTEKLYKEDLENKVEREKNINIFMLTIIFIMYIWETIKIAYKSRSHSLISVKTILEYIS